MNQITRRQGLWAAYARFIATGLLLSSVAGCALMHDDKAVLTQIPPERIRLADDIKLARDGWPEAQWWRRYGDPQLDALVARALKDGPAMAVARARVEASHSEADLVKASQGLFVGLSASIDRERVSAGGFGAPYAQTNPQLGTTGPWYTAGTVGLLAEYSVDLWGKQRDQVKAALGVHNASKAEAAQAELLLSSQIVHVYYDMQALYAVTALLVQARDIEQDAVAAHRAKAARGIEPRTPAETALAHRMELDKQIESAETRILMAREMLRALAGAGADALSADIRAVPLPQGSGQLPATLGYELLARRPDLQAMRWYVQSSFDQTEAAKAAFYPSFDIKAFAGFDAVHLGDLLKSSSRQINLIPGLTLPVFDSGRLNANLATNRARSNVLIAQYNESVLNAVREVAHASLQVNSIAQQAVLQDQKIESANFAFDSADAQYRRGLVDRVTAMEAKLPVLLEQARALELRSARIHAETTLATALGGGYGAKSAADSQMSRR
jgi:multidrug efflux system outer membrane protein